MSQTHADGQRLTCTFRLCFAVLCRAVQAKRVEEALQFMKACGMSNDMGVMNETEFYTSHECLLLDYEEALTRLDSTTNQW